MEVNCWCQTDVGLRREVNQDTFLANPALDLYIVADGMGGHKGGEVASKMAVEAVQDVVQQAFDTQVGTHPRDLITNAYREASRRIYQKSLANSELKGMGTTMVASILRDGVLFIGNVGDSRAYLFNDDGFWQITEDHSLVNEQLRAGLISENQIDGFLAKNVITRSVGFEEKVDCEIIERKLGPHDDILICSDGLNGMVSDRRIFEIWQDQGPKDAVPVLIEEAKNCGGEDNITVMMLSVKRN